LTSFFIDLWRDELAPLGFTLESPEDPDHRGSHVALGFAGGRDLVRRLGEAGVIADFRPPDLIRFGFAPLYNTHSEVVRMIGNIANMARDV